MKPEGVKWNILASDSPPLLSTISTHTVTCANTEKLRGDFLNRGSNRCPLVAGQWKYMCFDFFFRQIEIEYNPVDAKATNVASTYQVCD